MSRQSWINTRYPAVQTDELRILSADEWIRDMTFPARLFLKTVGISSVRYSDLPTAQEPLILNKLEQYQVRDFLMNQEQDADVNLMANLLPVGKTQEATWLISQQEQDLLNERLLQLNKTVTATTQRTWNYKTDLVLNITLPEDLNSSYWLSMQSASASERRRAQVWLEYLMWIAYLDDDSRSATYERIVVFSNKTLSFKGCPLLKHAII